MNERSLFEAALAIADPTEREQFLATQCGDDSKLLARVKGLLSSHEVAGSFLEIPVAPTGSLADRTTDFEGGDDDEDSSGPDLSFLEPSDKPGSLGRLGHYEVVQFLGQGAFGIVLKAFDEKLHRHVAIKAMDPRMARTSAPRKRFLREARSAAAVKHENIVQLYSVEEHPLPYLVMEFIEGQTLQSKLDASGPLELAEVLYLGRQMASGLAAAHAQGLIHRDIKPANILIENGVEKKVKITDFGLARTVDDATVTRTGVILGTPMFMAPEQALGQSVDHRTDLFSLGSVLYQMVTGRPPFRAPTALAVLKRVTDETPRPIRDIIPEIPTWFCAVVERLHAKNPEDRMQSANELAETLFGQAAVLHSGDLNSSDLNQDASAGKPLGKRYVNQPGSPAAFHDGPQFVGPEKFAPNRSNPIGKLVLAIILGGMAVLMIPCLALLLPRLMMTRVEITQTAREATAETQAVPPTTEQRPPDPFSSYQWPNDAPAPAIAPFSGDEAKAHQKAWADHLGIPVEWTDSDGVKFVLIPPGEFLMGNPKEVSDKLSFDLKQSGAGAYDQFVAKSSAYQRKVRLTQPFYLSAYEVTVGQYRKFIEESKYLTTKEQLGTGRFNWIDSATGDNAEQRAVIGVSWDDALAFCKWLGQRDGGEATLPTEAQWECACRAGTTTLWSFGDDVGQLSEYAVFQQGDFWPPEVVGTKKPNAFGLFDMHGNADEWCLDWHQQMDQSVQEVTDPAALDIPVDPSSGRAARGGGKISAPWWLRSATRAYESPANPNNPKGFRVAITGDLKKVVEGK